MRCKYLIKKWESKQHNPHETSVANICKERNEENHIGLKKQVKNT